MNPPPIRIDALAVIDGTGRCASPGSVLIESVGAEGPPGLPRLLSAGLSQDVARHPGTSGARILDRRRCVLLPGLVNAHAHLDLTHIGPRAHRPTDGFLSWVEMVRAARHTDDRQIAASVQRGIELSVAGGTVAIGDIAGAPEGRPSLAPWRTLASSGMLGVSFLEFFAIGKGEERGIAAADAAIKGALGTQPQPSGTDPVRLGLQPHAPNTVSRQAYRWAVERARANGLPLSTHLAETPEERRFIAQADGPQRTLLEEIGVWDDSILADVGRGLHPVEHLSGVLASTGPLSPFLAVHVNDADDAAIRTLAAAGARVAYCPRAAAYFGAPAQFGHHRYRDMLSAGICVALGTDSIINLWDAAVGGEAHVDRLSILDEMRFLHLHDRTDPTLLLRMGTTNGAAALGLDSALFTFDMGGAEGAIGKPIAGIVAIDVSDVELESPLDPPELVMVSSGRPELLFSRTASG